MEPGRTSLPTIWRGYSWSVGLTLCKDVKGEEHADVSGWTPTLTVGGKAVEVELSGAEVQASLSEEETEAMSDTGSTRYVLALESSDGSESVPVLFGSVPVRTI